MGTNSIMEGHRPAGGHREARGAEDPDHHCGSLRGFRGGRMIINNMNV